MEFEKLTKEEKNRYYEEVSRDIWQCVLMCADVFPEGVVEDIRQYLGHNELGLAIESLAYMVIQHEVSISRDVKAAIMRTFSKMGYEEDEPEQYCAYKEQLGAGEG